MYTYNTFNAKLLDFIKKMQSIKESGSFLVNEHINLILEKLDFLTISINVTKEEGIQFMKSHSLTLKSSLLSN